MTSPKLEPSGTDAAFIMGLRVGLGAALTVTDSWDGYTRKRIQALMGEASLRSRSQTTEPGEG
jgi:hypothetical protein